MSWIDDQKEKLSEFGTLLVSIILDAVLVIIVALVTELVKQLMEQWIFKAKLESLQNPTALTVYKISKIFIISAFMLYVALDLIKQMIKLYKKITNDSK